MSWTLHEACKLGDITYIKRLLSTNDNVNNIVNEADNKGYTPIEYAAYYNHIDIINLLLHHGANILDLHRLVLRSLTSVLIDACNTYRIDIPIHPIDDNMSIGTDIIEYMVNNYRSYYNTRTDILTSLSTTMRQHIDSLI